MNKGENESVSVRNLVEFILRSGDLDNTKGKKDAEAMLAGTRIHKKIQKSQPASYKAEVPLKVELLVEDGEESFMLTVEGRADGIIEGDPVIIDEIKSMYINVEKLEEPVPVHLAQAKCYAYIYALQNSCELMGVRMTYVSIETENSRLFHSEYSFSELKEWFNNLVKEYSKWLLFERHWGRIRNESIKKLQFPFEYRPGQKDFVAGVYRSIQREKMLFVEAPTGVGKTISTIFPA
ncbi:MAG: ATP-dependent DNA helicase, partial [Lachnospiraceae bacterium]|nr:ATP-dependent DNA helicase [Lachnospiraceae bacterium]